MKEDFDVLSPRSMYKNYLLFPEKIIVKRSKIHRWGVFARQKIKKYEIIEESPYFFVPSSEIKLTPSCIPYSYEFNEDFIIGMGFSGLYNHSFDPNVEYEVDKVNEIMRHYAIKDIAIDEELTLNYGEENVKDFYNYEQKNKINKE
jgi:uncharacterized protein